MLLFGSPAEWISEVWGTDTAPGVMQQQERIEWSVVTEALAVASRSTAIYQLRGGARLSYTIQQFRIDQANKTIAHFTMWSTVTIKSLLFLISQQPNQVYLQIKGQD